MPIYEYKCSSCSAVTSRLSRMDDDGADLHCEACGHEGLDKVFSVFASPKRVGGGSKGAPLPCNGCKDATSCPLKGD